LPTWIGWWAHQMPLWAHRDTAIFVYVAELGLPLLIWGPRSLRLIAFAGMLAMQAGVVLTANYGFFNYLSAALLLFILDDRDLGRTPVEIGTPALRPRDTVLATLLVALTIVPFLGFVPALRGLDRALLPVQRLLVPFRSINSYHLFAHMTLVRREPVIEGSADGVTWLSYELRYQPGGPDRPPPFVAPHPPGVDFQAWFLFLGPRSTRWFDRLLDRLLHAPDAVTSLFARDPFPTTPPRFVRVAVYRYRFTDSATRAAAGAWWQRDLLGYVRDR